jgi:hypothetical protein
MLSGPPVSACTARCGCGRGSRLRSVAFGVTGRASGLEEALVTWPGRAR